jgi:hypothetical protein
MQNDELVMQTLTEMRESLNQITVSLTRIEGKQDDHTKKN